MAAAPVRITLTQVRDLDAVGEAWRALECDADPSFFQSWTWVGCLAAERFTDPVLLQAERDGAVVGLGLFNRRRRPAGVETLWLNQCGSPELDSVFVEHNGLLLARDASDLLPACLAAILNGGLPAGRSWRRLWGVRIRLSGVDPRHLAAARQTGSVLVENDSVAPYVDLTGLASDQDAYLATLSANTRYQIRRSNRCLSRLGPLVVRHATTLPEALAWLEAMAHMHQAVWTARGEPGAFGNPEFLRFHRALLARALPRGEVELLRISAGSHVMGYLYNFHLGNRVLSYQSGFDYGLTRALAGPHAKPGLSGHHAAILRAQAAGAASYDFLAGPSRFKRSLARRENRLFWLDVAPRTSAQGLALGLHRVWQTRLVSGSLRRLGLPVGARFP